MKDGEAPVNTHAVTGVAGTVTAIVLHRGTRVLIGPTGTQVVVPWLTMQLLVALTESAGQFVEARQLQAMVWPDTHITLDALKQRVRLARQSLREAGYDPGLLDSVRGEGYALRVPLQEPPEIAAPVARVASPMVQQPRHRASSRFQRYRVGLVAAIVVVTGVFALTSGQWPSSVATLGKSVAEPAAPAAPAIGPVPVRVTLAREATEEPRADSALEALHANTRRTLAEHANVLIVPMPNGSACGSGAPAHLCARITGNTSHVRLEVTDRRSGTALVLGEWPAARAPDSILSNDMIAAQLAVLLSPGALRWIGEPRGRGDREFATLLQATKSAAACDVEAWRDATRALDGTAERAPQLHVARALRALLTVAIARADSRPAPVTTSADSTARGAVHALADSDALLAQDPNQALAHAAEWLGAANAPALSGNDAPRDDAPREDAQRNDAPRTDALASQYQRLRVLSPSAARLAQHLHTCGASSTNPRDARRP